MVESTPISGTLSGSAGSRAVQRARDQQFDVLLVALEVWRHGRVDAPRHEGTGEREFPSEADLRRRRPPERASEGSARKIVLQMSLQRLGYGGTWVARTTRQPDEYPKLFGTLLWTPAARLKSRQPIEHCSGKMQVLL